MPVDLKIEQNVYDVNVESIENISVSVNTEQKLNVTLANVGINGADAYEIAVRNGFVGTQAQWIDSLGVTSKSYLTLPLAQAATVSLPANTLVTVTNDPNPANNGWYTWGGTTLTKSTYDPLNQAKLYIDNLVGNSVDDAGIHARVRYDLLTSNFTDQERVAKILSSGTAINFLSGDLIQNGKTFASLSSLTALSFSRNSLAYALNSAGTYDEFAANTIRNVPFLGVFLERGATNALNNVNFATWNRNQTTIDVLTITNGAPTGKHNSFILQEKTTATNGASNVEYLQSGATAGSWVLSGIVTKQDNQFLMIHVAIGTSSFVSVIDFDAVGGATIQTASGSLAPAAQSITRINSTDYRLSVAVTIAATTNINWIIRGCGSTAFSSRSYATVAGRSVAKLSLLQIESGTVATSPMPTANFVRADDNLVLAWSGTNAQDSAVIVYGNKTLNFFRNQLISPTKINFLNDLSAPWLTDYIKNIYLIPAKSAVLSVNYTNIDARASAMSVQDLALLSSVNANRLTMGRAQQKLDYATTVKQSLQPTDNGCIPYYIVNNTNKIYYWNGGFYDNSTALVTSAGGKYNGNAIVFEAGEIGQNLLVDADFSTSVNGFDNVLSNATLSVTNGELLFTSSSNTNSRFGKIFKGYMASAFKLTTSYRKGTAAGVRLYVESYAGTPNFSQTVGVTSSGILSAYFTSPIASDKYIGAHQNGNPVGTSFFDYFTLQEVKPLHGFPNKSYTVYLDLVAPSTLPTTRQVIWQLDVGNVNDRVTLSIEADNTLVLLSRIWGTTGGVDYSQQKSINLGTVSANQSLRVAFSVKPSEIIASLNGTTTSIDSTFIVGGSYLRLLSSQNLSESYTGILNNFEIYSGAEDAKWLKKKTEAPISANKLYPKDMNRVVMVGDSYAEQSSTGIACAIADLGFDVVNLAAGGTTMTQQLAAIQANPEIVKNGVVVWWDGSPNGHVGNSIQLEKDLLQQALDVLGHDRWLWIRNGQLQISGATTNADMKNFLNFIKQKYGAVHAYDPTPVYQALAIQDPEATGYSADQTALASEIWPPSLALGTDTVHLSHRARRAIAADVAKQIYQVSLL